MCKELDLGKYIFLVKHPKPREHIMFCPVAVIFKHTEIFCVVILSGKPTDHLMFCPVFVSSNTIDHVVFCSVIVRRKPTEHVMFCPVIVSSKLADEN